MPDVWEDANGLKKNDPSDAQLTTVDGRYQKFLTNNVEMQIQHSQKGILIVRIYDDKNSVYSQKVHHF